MSLNLPQGGTPPCINKESAELGLRVIRCRREITIHCPLLSLVFRDYTTALGLAVLTLTAQEVMRIIHSFPAEGR